MSADIITTLWGFCLQRCPRLQPQTGFNLCWNNDNQCHGVIDPSIINTFSLSYVNPFQDIWLLTTSSLTSEIDSLDLVTTLVWDNSEIVECKSRREYYIGLCSKASKTYQLQTSNIRYSLLFRNKYHPNHDAKNWLFTADCKMLHQKRTESQFSGDREEVEAILMIVWRK